MEEIFHFLQLCSDILLGPSTLADGDFFGSGTATKVPPIVASTTVPPIAATTFALLLGATIAAPVSAAVTLRATTAATLRFV